MTHNAPAHTAADATCCKAQRILHTSLGMRIPSQERPALLLDIFMSAQCCLSHVGHRFYEHRARELKITREPPLTVLLQNPPSGKRTRARAPAQHCTHACQMESTPALKCTCSALYARCQMVSALAEGHPLRIACRLANGTVRPLSTVRTSATR